MKNKEKNFGAIYSYANASAAKELVGKKVAAYDVYGIILKKPQNTYLGELKSVQDDNEFTPFEVALEPYKNRYKFQFIREVE